MRLYLFLSSITQILLNRPVFTKKLSYRW